MRRISATTNHGQMLTQRLVVGQCPRKRRCRVWKWCLCSSRWNAQAPHRHRQLDHCYYYTYTL